MYIFLISGFRIWMCSKNLEFGPFGFFVSLDHGDRGVVGCMTRPMTSWIGLVTPRLSALSKLDDDLPQASNYNPKAGKQIKTHWICNISLFQAYNEKLFFRGAHLKTGWLFDFLGWYLWTRFLWMSLAPLLSFYWVVRSFFCEDGRMVTTRKSASNVDADARSSPRWLARCGQRRKKVLREAAAGGCVSCGVRRKQHV